MSEELKTTVTRLASTNSLVTLPLSEALEQFTPELEMALPDHIPVERFKRVVLTAINSSTPQNNLVGADRRSLFTACVRCAQDGLYPDGREAALVVFNTRMRDDNGQDYYSPLVTYMPMIQGIRKRMRNTGEVRSAVAEVVYANDHFRRRLGDNPAIEHEPPAFDQERGPPVGAYAIIKLYNGEVLYETMSVQEIERTRALSRAKDSLMWTKFWGEGARKTVLRRCAKQAPTGSDLDRLLRRDDELPEAPPLTQMRPVEPRPEIADFTNSGMPARRQRSRVRAAPQGAPAAISAAASPGEPEPERPWLFADEYGEVHEFEDVDEAVTSYAALLDGSRGDLKSLEKAWQNGARLLSALRERGRSDAADALYNEYGRLLEEDAEAAAAEASASDQPPAATDQPAYDVLVPMPEGMPANQWHMSCRERLREMHAAHRPREDFIRFREVNAVGLKRLQSELRSWYSMLSKEIDKGSAQ